MSNLGLLNLAMYIVGIVAGGAAIFRINRAMKKMRKAEEKINDQKTHAAAEGERPVQAQKEVKTQTVSFLGVLAAAYWYANASQTRNASPFK